MAHALFTRDAKTNSPLAMPETKAGEARHNQVYNPIRDVRRNVEINIGKACNNRCVFCIDGLPKREDRSYMPWEEMQRELSFWHASGSRSVGFLGGEPTTYPHIVEAVGFARDLGYTRIALATNATKLRLQHFTDKLLEAGLTRTTISMHGHTPELEDRITRVPGVFEKKVQAITYLSQKRRLDEKVGSFQMLELAVEQDFGMGRVRAGMAVPGPKPLKRRGRHGDWLAGYVVVVAIPRRHRLGRAQPAICMSQTISLHLKRVQLLA